MVVPAGVTKPLPLAAIMRGLGNYSHSLSLMLD
jgi:hypothetical protein